MNLLAANMIYVGVVIAFSCPSLELFVNFISQRGNIISNKCSIPGVNFGLIDKYFS